MENKELVIISAVVFISTVVALSFMDSATGEAIFKRPFGTPTSQYQAFKMLKDGKFIFAYNGDCRAACSAENLKCLMGQTLNDNIWQKCNYKQNDTKLQCWCVNIPAGKEDSINPPEPRDTI